MNEDQVFFQREEDAIIADAQTVFTRLAAQLLHIALQVLLERIESQPDFQVARKYWNKLKERLGKEGSQLVTNCTG